MDLARYKDHTVEDYVNEEGFWLWVLENKEEQQLFWQQFLQAYPEKQAEVEQAKQLVLQLNKVSEEFPASKVEAIWKRISASGL